MKFIISIHDETIVCEKCDSAKAEHSSEQQNLLFSKSMSQSCDMVKYFLFCPGLTRPYY